VKRKEPGPYEKINCPACKQCRWDTNRVTNPAMRCIYGGPFEGYQNEKVAIDSNADSNSSIR